MKVSNCYRQRFGRKARKYNKPRPLVDYLKRLKYMNNGLSILDVGSGPFSTIGVPDWPHHRLVLCDILAEEYHEIMQRRGIKPLIPVEKQDMEALTYPDGSFDFVHCRNALDHTKDPRAALREMARVVRPYVNARVCGRVYLRHYPNVGDRNNYTGDHHWNLEVVEGDCRIWNREDEFFISEIFDEDVSVRMDEGMVVCHWTK